MIGHPVARTAAVATPGIGAPGPGVRRGPGIGAPGMGVRPGPRPLRPSHGLASVVFALIVLERGVPEMQTLLTTVAVTVALSVVLHGLSSVPFVRVYHRWYEGHTEAHPAAAEAAPATMPRQRRHLPAADLVRPGPGE